MATEPRKVVVTGEAVEVVDYEKITVRHSGRDGIRYVHGKDGAQLQLRPGESGEIEVPVKEAERMRKGTEDGTHNNIVVEGAQGKAEKPAEKEMTRAELEEIERKNLDAARKSAEPAKSGGEGQAGGAAHVEKLGRGDLEAMTKDELLDYAERNGIHDVKASDNKGEIVSAILKAQRS